MNQYITSVKNSERHYIKASVAVAGIVMGSASLAHAQEVVVLPKIEMTQSAQSDKAYEENYKIDKSSSTKVIEDLVNTPQTISVISKKVMQEQQASTLEEALRNTPGVTLLLGENGNTNSKNNVSMRGFDVSSSIYKDGIREITGATRDTFNTEAVEVTKGTVGADNGRSVPSGYINQVSKSATNKDQGEVALAYDTGNSVRATADLNKMLSETSGIRLNVMKQKGDVEGRDEVKIDRTGIAGALGFGIGTDTRTSISYERYEQDDVPDGGIPTIGLDTYYNAALRSPSRVNSQNFYGSLEDFEKVKTQTFTTKIEHDFNDKTTLSNTSRYAKSNQSMLLTAPFDVITTTSGANSNANFVATDPSTWTIRRSGHTKWQENEILTTNTNVSSSIETGAILHKLSGGFDVSVENQTTKTITAGGTFNQADVYNPDPSTAISNLSLNPSGAKTFGETRTGGVYLFDSANIGENVIITGGGRLDSYKTTTKITTINADSTTGIPLGTALSSDLEDSGTLKSWKLGGVYKPLPNGSIYLSYANSQLPPGGSNFTLSATTTNASNPYMEPQKSETTELGTKWDLFDNKLSLTAAAYIMKITNEVMTESDGSVSQNGEKEVKGVELGVIGDITDKWSMSAGISKSKTTIERATNSGTSAQQGASLRFTPELSATLWTTYKVTPELSLGAGARYLGEQYASTSTATQNGTAAAPATIREIESYVVFDAMASYKINKETTAQLNVYNLTDEEYVANMNNSGRRYTPGTPRRAILSMNYKF